MKRTIGLLVILALASCGEDEGTMNPDGGAVDGAVLEDLAGDGMEPQEDASPEPDVPLERLVRFVHLSDPHIEEGDPQGPHAQALESAVELINHVSPAPGVVVATGDLMHYLTPELEGSGADGPMERFREIMGGLTMDWHGVAGNHDYYVSDDPYRLTADKAGRDAYIAEHLGAPAYQSFVYQGIKFILLNPMMGPLWDAAVGNTGSLDDDQLAWLREELDQGLPSLLFMHHPPEDILAQEGDDSLMAVLEAYPGQIKGLFSGHLHRFVRGTVGDVPSWIVGSAKDGDGYFFVVEYDRETGEVAIVNEGDLPFDELVEVECSPGVDAPLDEPEALVGTVQRLHFENATAEASGLGAHLGEMLPSLPIVVRFDDYLDGAFDARITMGRPPEAYVDYMDGAPCGSMTVDFTDPCLESAPVDLVLDATTLAYLITEEPLDPSWAARLLLKDLWFRARAERHADGPVLRDGMFYAKINTGQAILDLQEILVLAYCAGQIEHCQPGASEDMPLCPAEPTMDLYPQIPLDCDISTGDITVRILLLLLQPLGDEDIQLVSNISTSILELSELVEGGKGHPDLFATEEGMNCAP